MNKPDIARILEQVQAEIGFIQTTLKDKGNERFARPLIMAALMVGLSYQFVFKPPVAKLAGLDQKLKAARATAQYADRYNDVRNRLNAVYAVLPSPTDRSQGLAAAVIESLKAQGVMADSLQPPVENEISGMVVQNVGVTMTVSFSQLASWVLRIEAAKPAIHISALDVKKKANPIGRNDASCTLTMMIPKVRY